jgi:hypothetical protein
MVLQYCFEPLDFITEEGFTKYTNITAKLDGKLFTKVIRTNQRSLSLDRQRVQ